MTPLNARAGNARLAGRTLAGSVLAVLLAGVSTGGVRAQDVEGSEAFLTQVVSVPRAGPVASELLQVLGLAAAFPGQSGGGAILEGLLGVQLPGNTAVVEQIGDGNAAFVSQSGLGNVAVVHQIGSFNRVRALQAGDDNLFAAWLEGSDNDLTLIQRGTDNQYFLQFTGDDLAHTVVQEGTGLRATQVGVGSLPFGIRQRGTGARVRIEHNPIVR